MIKVIAIVIVIVTAFVQGISLRVHDEFCWPLCFLNGIRWYNRFRKDSKGYLWVRNYEKINYRDIPVIPFEQFKDMYILAPEKYTRGDDRREKVYFIEYRQYNSVNPTAVFTFSYSDWKKYFKWKKALDTEKAKAIADKERLESIQVAHESLKYMLEDVQKDIDKLHKKAQQEQEEAEENIVKVAENLRERRSSGDTSRHKMRRTEPPQVPGIVTVLSWPDHDEYIDETGHYMVQTKKKGR